MEAAQSYENSKQSLRQTRRSSKAESSKRGKKNRKNRRKESSGSSTSSGESSSEEQSSKESESKERSPPQRISGSKGYRKPRDRVVVKEELPDDRHMLKDIQSSLAGIIVRRHKIRYTIFNHKLDGPWWDLRTLIWVMSRLPTSRTPDAIPGYRNNPPRLAIVR